MGFFSRKKEGGGLEAPNATASGEIVSADNTTEKKGYMAKAAERRAESERQATEKKERSKEKRAAFWQGVKGKVDSVRNSLSSGWESMKKGVGSALDTAKTARYLPLGEMAGDAASAIGRGLEAGGRAVAGATIESGKAIGRTAQSGAEYAVAGALAGAMAVDSGVRAAGRGVERGVKGAVQYTQESFRENWDMLKEGASDAKKVIMEKAAEQWDGFVARKDQAVETVVSAKDAVVGKFNSWRLERARDRAKKDQEKFRASLQKLEALGGTIAML